MQHNVRKVALVLAGLLTIAGGKVVWAATIPTQQPAVLTGISMTPAIQDRVLGPADKSTSFTVELFNSTDKPLTLALSTADFSALNQTGGVAFLGSDAANVTNGHGLSGYIKLDAPLVTLPPNATKKITATIADVSKLAPGGHYAAVIARTALGDPTGSSGNKVSINQAISSLVFLETAGKGTKALTLLPPTVSKVSFSLPDSANLVFKATGNTQVVPRGVVDVLHGDKRNLHSIINENSSLVLPGSTRLLQTPLSGSKHPWWPGMYTLRVQYRFDGSLGVTTYQKSFLYINIQALIIIILLIIALVLAALRLRKYWATRPNPAQAITKRIISIADDSPGPHKITVSKVLKK